MTHRPAGKPRPAAEPAGSSGTTLPQKLGIEAGTSVARVDDKVGAIDGTRTGLEFARRK